MTKYSWGIGKTKRDAGFDCYWESEIRIKFRAECGIGKENDVRDRDGRSSGWGVSVNKERDQDPDSSFPDLFVVLCHCL